MRATLPFILVLAACSPSARPESPERPVVPVSPMPAGPANVSGPYVHENLAVFVIHGADTDRREFITLEEGFKAGTVLVTENAQARVNQLQIENRSDMALFLQEGDRLKGGKQDRMIGSSLVIPPRSGVQPVPSFCIEQSRWQGHATFEDRKGGEATAGKSARMGAKVRKDQKGVWRSVEQSKYFAGQALGFDGKSSSLNETLDSPQLAQAMAPYKEALGGLLASASDAIGVAFVLNGKLEEACVYPNAGLARRVYPRLLLSYAAGAVLEKKSAEPCKVTQADVVAFMRGEGSVTTETIDTHNVMVITDCTGKVACDTKYEGVFVHRQWFRKEDQR